MAQRSGSGTNLRSAATFALADTWYAATNTITVGAQANALMVGITSAVASPGDVELYFTHSHDGGSTYFTLGSGSEDPEVFGPIGFTGAAQSRSRVIPGLMPGEIIQLYFRASANAASSTLAIEATSFMTESSALVMGDVSVGDVEVNLENVTENEDAALGTSHPTLVVGNRVADLDGTALPTQGGTEGDTIIAAHSGEGVAYGSPTTIDGSDSAAAVEDEAKGSGKGTAVVMAGGTVATLDGTAIPTLGDTEGDASSQSLSPQGVAMEIVTTLDGEATPVAMEDAAKAAGVGTAVVMGGSTVADFDGSAIPTLGDTQGDVASSAVSGQGVAFTTVTTTDGASTPIVAHDAAMAGATGGDVGQTVMAEAETLGAVSTVNAAGDATRIKASTSGILHATITDPTGASDVGAAMAASLAEIDNAVVVDDAAFTPATTSVVMAGATFDDASPDSIDEGDGGALRCSANRNLYGTVRDAAGNERGANVTASYELNVIESNIGTAIGTDGAAGPAAVVSVGGTQSSGEIEELRVDSDGHLQADVLTLPGGLIGYAEDVAHGDGDIGLQMLTRRIDAAASSAGTSGDYATLNTDATGQCWVVDAAGNTLLGTIDTDTGVIAGDTTSIDAKLPGTLGQKAMAASLAVVLASDQTSIPTTCGGTRTVTSATGSGSGTIATATPGADADLKSVTILFGGALAAAETVTVSIDALDGGDYDAVLKTVDVGTSGLTSFSWVTDHPLESGDAIVVALSANTGNKTWGVRVVTDA
ncbi:MAG: hypothetical protein GY851_07615, partial [bacterium]|nr:hypothetical protein [bacterium]